MRIQILNIIDTDLVECVWGGGGHLYDLSYRIISCTNLQFDLYSLKI